MSAVSKSGVAWGERLLAERALRLAERPSAVEEVARRFVCLCEAGDQLYGLPVEQVSRVLAYVAASPLANAAPSLLGIVSRGGGFALVYDLAALFGGEIGVAASGGHLILLRALKPLTGLRVTRSLAVANIVVLAGEEAASLPQRTGICAYGRGPGGRVVSIIDIEALVDAAGRGSSGG